MAKMYPVQIDPETKSPGEIEIFRRLRDDPITEGWLVLHSLDVANHRSQVVGELDFVVVIPSKGIVCLEVKAHRHIVRNGGTWFMGNNSKPDYRGPFKQASEAMHSIRKYLTERNSEFSKLVYWSAVIFPYVEFTEISPEWHPWQVIDSRLFISRSMGDNILSVINRAREFLHTNPNTSWFDIHSPEPTTKQCKLLVNTLRPEFEFFESPLSRRARRSEELKRYTQEQYEALDSMEENDRVIFAGPAGTGKTLLALEAARKSNTAGHKTLLICFNRLLGSWINEQAKPLQANITTSTLHGQMLRVVKVEPPAQASKTFWEYELPNMAIDHLLESGSDTYQFDRLIIDEAQDLLKDVYLDFLDLSLKGGLASGKWIMFGDFEKQVIYEKDQEVRRKLEERFRCVPRYSLRVNCRNTPRIAEYVHMLGGLNPKYSRIRRPDNNLEPKVVIYKTEQEQKQELEKILKLLQKEHIELGDIVILSSKKDETSVATLLSDEWKEHVISIRQQDGKNCIGYSTIHAFKGLEAPVVILADIEQVSTASAASLFYIGITRALDRLYILVNDEARKEMLDVLEKGTN